MKRVGRLIGQIADLDNLYLAFSKACKGKQRKQEVLSFREHFDENIASLRNEILSGNVQVGNYHYFTIHDPKERVICAAPFRERVLHHALMNVCHPYFDRSLIDSTHATRPGKGVYTAINQAVAAATHYNYLLKLDFRKYYDSIDHAVLKQMLEKKFKDSYLLRIFGQIIDSYHADTGCGLPIGNLTSQYFANLYLSALDHYAKEKVRTPIYIRYMDDILIAGNDKHELMAWKREIEKYASERLHLTLKPPVCNSSSTGVVFLGYRILPRRILLSGRSKKRFRTKLVKYQLMLGKGIWNEQQYAEHIMPLLSYTQHAESRTFRLACMEIADSVSKIKGDNQRVGLTA